jgi:hypothetical protein
MLEWITERAESASAVLVSAAATDAPVTATSGVLRVFRRAGQRRERLPAGWLDADAAAFAAAGTGERDRLRRELLTVRQARLAGLLGEFPGAPRDIRNWSGALQAQLQRGHGLPLTWGGVTMVALAPAAGQRGE